MSYHILYARQFVKLSDGRVLPMVLSGDNNCFMDSPTGAKMMRSRDWHCSTWYNGNDDAHALRPKAVMPEVIVGAVKAEIEKYEKRCETDEWYKKEGYTVEQVRKSYGWFTGVALGGAHTTRTSASGYLAYWENGIKDAKTVEELDAMGIHLRIYNYQSAYESVKYLVEPPEQTMIKTDAQFLEELSKWEAWSKACAEAMGKKEPMRVSVDFVEEWNRVLDQIKRSRKANRNREMKEVRVSSYVTLKNQSGFLTRYRKSGGYGFVRQPEHGKRFLTEREAEAYRKKLVKRGNYDADTWMVTVINEPATLRVAA